ncbi:MAG: hypothetical protein A07HB70_00720 [uncultured archaeon A07HB70]|nr:MAG: hypothetical protein A07HB70_00720 [uncultured archaeon A07HB70]
MRPDRYEVVEATATLDEGDVLSVTDRFGPRAPVEMVLRGPDSPSPETLVVTDRAVGFDEYEILDPTARLGDWHEYALAFDAGASRATAAVASPGPARVPTEVFRRIAAPAGETA